MCDPTYICSNGHYSILNPDMFSLSPDGIEISCAVCEEKIRISCVQTNHPRENPEHKSDEN